MRILIYIHSLECGGAERVISLLANNWEASGHVIKLVTNTPVEKDFYEINKNIYRDYLKKNSKNKQFVFFERLINLTKKIREFKPDLAVTFMTTANLIYILSKFLVPKHVHIISERIDPIRQDLSLLKKLVRIFLYIFPSALVVQTNKIKDWFSKYTLSRRIRIINNPIKLIEANKNKINNKFTILFVGRLFQRKGINLLIKSFTECLKENKDMELVIIGDGPLYKDILKKIKSDDSLINTVKLKGKQKNIDYFYRNCNLLVIPSEFEGFPNVLLEGLNYNLNVISTRIIDDYESFRNIENIRFIEVDDLENLTKSIKYFYNKKTSNRLKSKRLIKKLEKYEIKRISNEWIKLYEELK
tara:strand:- start:2328 stop:3401 length:1074 start_codon:yes stop_codon:yes gene_type:complete